MSSRKLLVVACLLLLGLFMAVRLNSAFAYAGFTPRVLQVTQSQQADPRGSATPTTGDPRAGADCTSSHQEISPLIAKRRTGTRVYVTKDDAPNATVQGLLYVQRGGKTVWWGRSLNTLYVNKMEICDILPELEDETLNFEVPYNKLSIGVYLFKAVVYPIGGSPTVDGKTIQREVTVANRRAPRVVGVPIDYRFPRP